jgi:glycerophosphoryl diester phosphodiesterase
MALPLWLEKPILELIDYIYAKRPQPVPNKEKLDECRIISHRGAHDNLNIFENTFPAFDRVQDTGVWGIEFDIRWTRDLHPVVFHDKNLRRLFGSTLKISDLSLSELKTSFGLIPALDDVIARYGKKQHLMVEIKKEVYPDPDYQNRVLQDMFTSLEPDIDFHFLAIDPEMFNLIGFVPATTFLPIAEINVARFSSLSIQKNYGGILGHYLLLTDSVLNKHQRRHQKVGTGFVNSQSCLFRELNRGVTWIFSQNALELQSVYNDLLKGD